MPIPSLLRTAVCASLLLLAHDLPAADPATTITAHHIAHTDTRPTIQVALLLDDSGSMQGLINQARAQLWDLVQHLGRFNLNGQRPRLEVALYHYGDLPALAQPLLGFSSDLDRLSEVLFTINGGGGTEACGHVIQQSLEQLAWRPGAQHLRLVVIAGNEPFDQGGTPWRDAVASAVARGIVVHAIHCGPRADGIAGHWSTAADAGRGTFTCIDQNVSAALAAPQDVKLGELNHQLNDTYVGYGVQGAALKERQVAEDGKAAALGSLSSRSCSKAGAYYCNPHWDVVDAVAAGVLDLSTATAANGLPERLARLEPAARVAEVQKLAAERQQIQTAIATISQERAAWIASQSPTGAATLGDGLRAALTTQANAAGYTVAP